MLLRRLGFRPDEIHYGELLRDGRVVVPAAVGGESARLLLDTERRTDLSINIGYATQQGWPYERRAETWGMSPLADAFALGRGRPHEEVVVYGAASAAETVYYTAGKLGTRYVHHAVLAIDPVDAAVGLSERVDLAAAPPAGAHRVRLVETTLDRLPVTLDLADDAAPAVRPRFMVDTARLRSVISLAYTERAWRSGWARRRARRAAARERTIDVYLRPPGGERAWLEMDVVDDVTPDYGSELGAHVDGYLGLDFLYRWLPVLDLPRAALWLVPLDERRLDGRATG